MNVFPLDSFALYSKSFYAQINLPCAVLFISVACNMKQHGDGLLRVSLGAIDSPCSCTLYTFFSKHALMTAIIVVYYKHYYVQLLL